MQLNREVGYRTRFSDNGAYGDVCSELAHKTPSYDCLTQPSVLVVHYDGAYYVVKSRWEIEGDPCNSGRNPVNPYDLEFTEYTLQEVRAMCATNGNYKLPDDFIGKNILIQM